MTRGESPIVVDGKLTARPEDKTASKALIRAEHVLGLSRSDVSSLLGVPENRLDAPRTWPRQSHATLLCLSALADRLEDTFESASIQKWLHAPSRDLQWRIPFALLREGQLDLVDAALEAIDSGVYV